MNKKEYTELGKKGADKRWAKRYEILLKLSAYTGKELQDKFRRWPTKVLEVILRTYEDVKKVQKQ